MPECQLCKGAPATIDGKTQYGPWAYMCDQCHASVGVGLGTGKGQRLKEEDAPVTEREYQQQRQFQLWVNTAHAYGIPRDRWGNWFLMLAVLCYAGFPIIPLEKE